jgi:hypothetical protein
VSNTPKWLDRLERPLGWIAVPHIGVLFITLQALGFLMVMSDPAWSIRLALFPPSVMAGEYWRLITFLALPLSLSPLWVIFTLLFLYFIFQVLEANWGAFKTTLYVLISVLVTIAFSFAFDYPVTDVSRFESTIFLAAAALVPEMEVRLYFAIPVKVKWMALFAFALLAWDFVRAPWLDRFFILAIFSNYLIFFGPAIVDRVRQYARRRSYLAKTRR